MCTYCIQSSAPKLHTHTKNPYTFRARRGTTSSNVAARLWAAWGDEWGSLRPHRRRWWCGALLHTNAHTQTESIRRGIAQSLLKKRHLNIPRVRSLRLRLSGLTSAAHLSRLCVSQTHTRRSVPIHRVYTSNTNIHMHAHTHTAARPRRRGFWCYPFSSAFQVYARCCIYTA